MCIKFNHICILLSIQKKIPLIYLLSYLFTKSYELSSINKGTSSYSNQIILLTKSFAWFCLKNTHHNWNLFLPVVHLKRLILLNNYYISIHEMIFKLLLFLLKSKPISISAICFCFFTLTHTKIWFFEGLK